MLRLWVQTCEMLIIGGAIRGEYPDGSRLAVYQTLSTECPFSRCTRAAGFVFAPCILGCFFHGFPARLCILPLCCLFWHLLFLCYYYYCFSGGWRGFLSFCRYALFMFFCFYYALLVGAFSVNVPFIFYCPADHVVPDWYLFRMLYVWCMVLGNCMVEARSANNVKNLQHAHTPCCDHGLDFGISLFL